MGINPTANFTPIGFRKIAEVLALCSVLDPQICNHFDRFGIRFVEFAFSFAFYRDIRDTHLADMGQAPI
jgi:hypothetical protein